MLSAEPRTSPRQRPVFFLRMHRKPLSKPWVRPKPLACQINQQEE
jgi:hypothetical protein